ncbi:hypothetical protein GH714_036318 [Hevea brasiliensis]|uniref:Uncharacterized protein n=1 Tax=Hevea brasiliensis TaxID=3981 RepID=A0A6A6NEQ3_HEVBR|nr:hypothetical protein GH714_036318 [Hevea brasiliensis]
MIIVTVPTSKGGIRRKHHRAWTLSEVMKLVEGVSRYGAGRWSEIKRLAFASYSYRTSVDLKDKWRNLLKASFAHIPSDKGVNSRKNAATMPIPEPILLRVRELAERQSQVPPNLTSGKEAGSSGSSAVAAKIKRDGDNREDQRNGSRDGSKPEKKATDYHLGQLKAKIAKLRTQLLEPPKVLQKARDVGDRYNASPVYVLILYCAVLFQGMIGSSSKAMMVIAVSKSSDIVLMVLDTSKSEGHQQILTRELEAVGLCLTKRPPQIYFKKKKTGGISFNSTVPVTHVDEKLCYQILHEYKIHNAEVLFREDATVDDLIDVNEGNRKYMKCIYVYNKIDVIGIDDVDKLARQPNSIVISCNLKLNLDRLLAKIWEEMGLVRVYTKPQGKQPDFTDPVVLSADRGGCSVEDFCNHIHRSLVKDVKYVLVWGLSARHYPQHRGLGHVLQDEDVVQIVKKKVMNA